MNLRRNRLPVPPPPARARAWAWRTWLAPVWLLLALPLGAADAAPDPRTLRLGFSAAMFAGVKDSDVKASLTALTANVSRERQIPAEPEPYLYDGAAAVAAALHRGEINAVGLTTVEFGQVRREVAFDTLLIAMNGDDRTEVYVLLVRADAGIDDLTQLQGRRLLLGTGSRMSLALPWLDAELAQRELPNARRHLASVAAADKASKPVLAVFFKEADACVVTRRTWETMVELNPQVGRQLRELAASPPYIPAVFAFAARYPSEFKQRTVAEFTRLHLVPAGQQVLTVFRSPRVVECALPELAASLALVEAHAAPRHASPAGGGPESVSPPLP